MRLVRNWYQVGRKHCIYQILCRKNVSILTTLKRSSLAYQCIFYRPENNKNRERPKN